MNSNVEDIFKSKRLYFKFITSNDTEKIINWRNNIRVRERFIFQETFTNSIHEKWLNERIQGKGDVVQFIIYENSTDKAIGSVYLRDIDKNHSKAEYGIFIGDDNAIGKGYGTESAKFIIKYAFKVLKLHKVMLRVFSDNIASIRTNEKAGFKREAYLHDDVCINGEYKDIILMAILNK